MLIKCHHLYLYISAYTALKASKLKVHSCISNKMCMLICALKGFFLFTKKSVLFELYDFLLSISIRKKKSICLLSINIAYYRYLKTSVLVYLDYWNKTPQSWWLKNKFIFHSFTYWKAKDQGMSTFGLLRASSSKTPIPWVLRWWTGEGIPQIPVPVTSVERDVTGLLLLLLSCLFWACLSALSPVSLTRFPALANSGLLLRSSWD